MSVLLTGSFICGSPKAIDLVYRTYYEIHDEWLEKGRFVGKEQNIFNELVFNRNEESSSSVVRLRSYGLNCSSPIDVFNNWFLYQHYLAQLDEYLCPNEKFSLLIF